MRTTGPTKEALYNGRWKHPGTPGENIGVSSG